MLYPAAKNSPSCKQTPGTEREFSASILPPFSSQSFGFLERRVSTTIREQEAPEPLQNKTH